jgi:hypothetical protein
VERTGDPRHASCLRTRRAAARRSAHSERSGAKYNMKRLKILVLLAVSVICGFALGYIRGNRSASLLHLEQAAMDNIAGYKMLTDAEMSQWRPDAGLSLLRFAVRNLDEERALLNSPLSIYEKRHGPYEVRIGSRQAQVESIDSRLTDLRKMLEKDGQTKSPEPSARPYGSPAAGSPSGQP